MKTPIEIVQAVLRGGATAGLAALLAFASPAQAKELEVIGRASIGIPSSANADVQGVRAAALREAKKSAVRAAIGKVLGPEAGADEGVAGKIDAVIAQVPDERITNTKGARVGDAYEVSVTLVLDDKEFRTLLSDLGVAVNTANIRSHSILMVMDEFHTTPRDLKAPLEELEEFSDERRVKVQDKSISRAAAANEQGNTASMAHSAGTAKSLHVNDIDSDDHQRQVFKKLTRFQPASTAPEAQSQTLNALSGELQQYDLRILDNDVFRSSYFKDKPLTIEAMQNSAALAGYVSAAKRDANADFFLVGASILIDSGKNANSGDQECTGVMTVKTYSTVDGESIGSETVSEASVGRNVNDCEGNVAKKLASVGGPILGARIQDHWKKRATYGQELVVTLTGKSLTLMTKSQFTKSLKGVTGVDAVNQRISDGKKLQLVVTYKGTEPLEQALAESLSGNPNFSTLDAQAEGNQVHLCLGPCSPTDEPAPKP